MSSRLLLVPVLVAGLLALSAARSDEAKRGPIQAKDVPAKTVTLSGKLALSKVLGKLKEQTGVVVRAQGEDDPELTLDLKKAPFWKALNIIAKDSDRRVVLGRGGEGTIALMPGYRELPTSYQGPFRVTLKRMVALRDLESDTGGTLAHLEVAWQSPFQAYVVLTDPESLVVQDNKGLALENPVADRPGRASVDSPLATGFDITLPAVRRAVPRLGLLKGNLTVIGSPKLLTFSFVDLQKGKDLKQEGVSVKLDDVDTSKELWSFRFVVKYPADGPKVEGLQMQNWLIRNDVYLLNRKTGKKFPSNGGFEIDDQSATEATITYRFTDDDETKVRLGKATDWTLGYRTPGQITEVILPFEFKDVPLP